MRGVDDEHVDAGLDQGLGALGRVVADAHRRADESRPSASLVARGYCSDLVKSLTVIRPASRPSASTSGSFSILCSASSASASSRVTPTGAVTSGIGVMTSRTGRREVGLEAHVPVGDDADQHAAPSVTGTPEMRYGRTALDVGDVASGGR